MHVYFEKNINRILFASGHTRISDAAVGDMVFV